MGNNEKAAPTRQDIPYTQGGGGGDAFVSKREWGEEERPPKAPNSLLLLLLLLLLRGKKDDQITLWPRSLAGGGSHTIRSYKPPTSGEISSYFYIVPDRMELFCVRTVQYSGCFFLARYATLMFWPFFSNWKRKFLHPFSSSSSVSVLSFFPPVRKL